MGRNGREGEWGRGRDGGGRRETGKRGWKREREPDVLIKRLIFIARQKRWFNAHRGLMRRPTAASTCLAGTLVATVVFTSNSVLRVAANSPMGREYTPS